MNLKPNPEDEGVITKQFLKKLTRSDFRQYYSTPSLNDILYLHYKGFQKIDNLEEFTGLKVLYLEGNAIKKIENLQQLTNLRCLYLQENLIREMSSLDAFENLVNLNLSDNMIEKIEGLEKCFKLATLQIKRNRIGADGLNDLVGLLQCQSISALDVSDNKIDDQKFVDQILAKMTNLNVVYLQNNTFNKKISHYRKTLINKIPTLKYIDDKPIFQDEKRFAEAWARGGLEAERQERAKYKKQKQDQHMRNHEAFQQMMRGYKEKHKQEMESSSENLSDSREESLDTYNTPVESKETSERDSSKQVSETSSQNNDPESAQNDLESKSVSQASQNEATTKDEGVPELQSVKNTNKEPDSSRYLDELD